MKGIPVYQVDAFTDRPYGGNPAAVCLLSRPREERWMQAVAAEMNLSETAFLLPEGENYRLRWFTPTMEVDLCGHATLAAAHLLWEEGMVPEGRAISFQTRSGILRAVQRQGWIELDFPAEPPEVAVPPPGLEGALGVEFSYVGRNRMDLFVEIPSAKLLRTLDPDLHFLAALPVRGIIVTAPSDVEGVDFLSRFFAPGAGIPEDPVTGSAHCALAPYWGRILQKSFLAARQVSPRGGALRVRCAGERVILGGKAVTVLKGEFLR